MKKLILLAAVAVFFASTSIAQNVGIGTTSPSAKLHIVGDDGILATGTYGSGTASSLGAGTRMMWYPKKAAFRAGGVTGTQWDDANIGQYSFAAGTDVKAGGFNAVALGANNNSSGGGGFTMGALNTASGTNASAFGQQNTASGYASFAGGVISTSGGDYSFALGENVTASGQRSAVVGVNNNAYSYGEFVVGVNATNYTPTSTSAYSATDRIFDVGNGTASGSRSDAMTILKNGNTGIGTALPSTILHVKTTSGNSFLTIDNSSSTVQSGISLASSGTTKSNIYFDPTVANYGANGALLINNVGAGSPNTLLNPSGNGAVGIGVSGIPSATLHVNGTTQTTNFRMTGNSPAAGSVLVSSNGSGDAAWASAASVVAAFGSGTQNYVTKFNNAGGTTIGNSNIFDNGSNVGIGINSGFTGLLHIKSNANTFMTIDNSAASQQSGIALASSGTTKSNIYFDPTVATYGVNGALVINNVGATTPNTVLNPGNANVGIGVLIPTNKLEVAGNTKTTNFQMTSGATASYLLQSDASGNGSWVNANTIAANNIYNADGSLTAARTVTMAANNLTLNSTSGNFIVNPSSTGKVGIGTALPSTILHVKTTSGNSFLTIDNSSGTVQSGISLASSGTTKSNIYFDPTVATYGANGALLINNVGAGSANTLLNPSGNGNVGIGVSGIPSATLHVSGTTQTTNFRMTNGAAANYLLQSDASGNGTWVNPTTIGVTSITSASPLTTNTAATGAVTVNLTGIVPVANGGTNLSSYTTGDVLYASAATTIAKLADVAAGSYLRSGGVGTAPVWSTLILPNAATTGDLHYASAANTISNLADVAVGSVLTSGGVGVAPAWSSNNGLNWTLKGNSGITIPAAPATYGTSTFGASENWLGNTDAKDLTFGTTNIERMRILAAGNVGVGTAVPTQRLSVRYDADNAGVMSIDNATAGGFAGIYFYQSTSANYRGHIGYVNTGGASAFGGKGTFQIASGNRPFTFSATNGAETFNEVMRIDNTTGNVGIGSTAPTERLRVVDAGNSNPSSGTFAVFANNLTQGVGIGYQGISAVGSNLTQDLNLLSKSTGNINLITNGTTRVNVSGSTGVVQLSNLAGTGNRPVYADASGNLKVANGDNTQWVMSTNMMYSSDDFTTTVIDADGDDDRTIDQTLPFNVTIEGTAYTNIAICTNGWASFETAAAQVTTTTYSATTLPTSSFNNPTVFPLWTDQKDYGGGEFIAVQTVGSSPNRTYTVQWQMRGYTPTGTTVAKGYYQMQIHETSNVINVKYYNMNPILNGQSWLLDGSPTKNTAIGFQLGGGASAKAFPITYNGKVLDDNASGYSTATGAGSDGWSVCPLR